MARQTEILVVGQIARDLVLVVDEVPAVGSSGAVDMRREMLGGKGANQAVLAAQLGARVALLGVVGDDAIGQGLLDQARRDGIDVSPAIRRDSTATGLITEILDSRGDWRYLEDLPTSVKLTRTDVTAARPQFEATGSVIVQLQQPAEAVLAAVELARGAGCRVIVDGVPNEPDRQAVLRNVDVLRADAHEAQLLAGVELKTAGDTAAFGRRLLREGPGLVALAVEGEGNVVVWENGSITVPLIGPRPVDTTGAGDAFTAALAVALHGGLQPPQAARWASAAAALTVRHPGGRPDLSAEEVRRCAESLERG